MIEDEEQGEVLKSEVVGGATHGKAVGFRKVHEAAHGGCEGVGIADRSEEAGAVGEEGFCSTGCVGGDDGESVGGGFKWGEGKALPKRGEDAGMGGAEVRLKVGDEAEEVDAGGEDELVCELLECREIRAGAGDGEVGGGGELGKSAEEGRVVLEGDKAAYGEPAEEAICCGSGGSGGGYGDGVVEDGTGGGGDKAGAKEGDVRGVADGCEVGGERVGDSEEKLLCAGAERGGVDSGYHNTGWDEEADEAGEEDGVGEVGVEDVRPMGAVPAEEGEPAAGVEPGFPHLEAKERDAGCCEGGGLAGGGTGEDDDCDLEATLREGGGEGEDLALGTADLVEGRDEDCDMGHGRLPVARCMRHCCQAGMEFSRLKGARKVWEKRMGGEPGLWRASRAVARAAERDSAEVAESSGANHTPGAWASRELSAGKVAGRTRGRPAAAASSIALGMPSRVDESTKRVASWQ